MNIVSLCSFSDGTDA